MKNTLFVLGLAGSLVFQVGCASHSETVYSPVPRVKVSFENEKAGRMFYEKLSTMPSRNKRESETEICIPILFSHKRTVLTDDNQRFNDAVARCDTNQDGTITESEAQIFAAQK